MVRVEPRISRKRSESKQQKTARRRRERKLNGQRKEANTRAKYGPSMKPAPVTVRRLDGAEVVTDQDAIAKPSRVSPVLERAAQEAGWPSYAAYLASPAWKALRRRVMERDRWRCVLCGSKKNLQVHHDRYDGLGREELRDLKTVCTACHEHIHE